MSRSHPIKFFYHLASFLLFSPLILFLINNQHRLNTYQTLLIMNTDDDDDSTYYHNLSEDTLLRLQNNDSNITAVDVLFGQGRGWHPLRRSQSFDAFDIDWSILAGNTHLNKLRVGLGSVGSSDHSRLLNKLEAFYTYCAHIRSIESLGIWDTCSPFPSSPFVQSSAVFTALPPLFVHNNLVDLTY